MSESNLADRAAIHDLFTRYCCALDNGEIETVVDCFAADAILKSPVIDCPASAPMRQKRLVEEGRVDGPSSPARERRWDNNPSR